MGRDTRSTANGAERANVGGMNHRLLAASAGIAVVSLVAGGCGDDDVAPTAESSVAITTTAAASESTVAAPETTAPDTTAETLSETLPETLPETTPVSVAPAGWVPVGPMPSLAYAPCCASNYSGEPSPAIPADPSAALMPGIYHAFREQPGDGEPVQTDSISFSLAPFVACGTAGISCEEGFVAGDVGVGDVARKVSLPLNGDVRVVVGGFGCAADGQTFATDHQAATGVELAELQIELDSAFNATVAPLVVADTAFEDYNSIFAQPLAGFSVPCLNAGLLQFRGSAGPAVLLQILGVYDSALDAVVIPPSISIAIINLNAIEVGADGSQTLYFYAGFYS